ncbi:hypothetical protein [Bradyrhizobium sp. BR 1432]|uniref:hypothetical protein n=1 Tax=Bradyrhizobium sp. BR 1432 TaxID=3447966 RepID=UPI003EE63290
MDRLKFGTAFEATVGSAGPAKLAVLRDATRERGRPDEFAITSTELIRKASDYVFGLLKIISDAAHRRHRP